MKNFWLFKQTKCEEIVKYTNGNLLELEWIRTWIRTLDVYIGEKNKNIETRQNVTGSYKKNECNYIQKMYKLYITCTKFRVKTALNLKCTLFVHTNNEETIQNPYN